MMQLMFVIASFFRHRIVSAPSPRVAAENPFHAQVAAIKKPVRPERPDHVMRAGRLEAARRRKQRRYRDLVKPDYGHKRKYDDFFEAQNL